MVFFATVVRAVDHDAIQDYSNGVDELKIGITYERGEDYDQALKWYRLAADKGNAAAQKSLGYMYDAGLGVKQDYDQAVKWYRLAADQGLELAKNSLRNIYNRFKSQPKLKNSESNYIIIKNNPDSNLLGKGFMKIAQMDYEGAINDFTKEIKLHPQSNYAFIYRGIAKTCINDYKSGRKDFVKASQISPEKAFSYNHLWESIIQTNPRGSFGEALLVQGADISYYTKLAIKVLDSLTGK